MSKVSYRLIYLNTRFPIGGGVWGGCGTFRRWVEWYILHAWLSLTERYVSLRASQVQARTVVSFKVLSLLAYFFCPAMLTLPLQTLPLEL